MTILSINRSCLGPHASYCYVFLDECVLRRLKVPVVLPEHYAVN